VNETLRGITLIDLARTTVQAIKETTGITPSHPSKPYDHKPLFFLDNTFMKAKRTIQKRDSQWQEPPRVGRGSPEYSGDQVVQILEEVRQIAHGADRRSRNVRETLRKPDEVIDAIEEQLRYK